MYRQVSSGKELCQNGYLLQNRPAARTRFWRCWVSGVVVSALTCGGFTVFREFEAFRVHGVPYTYIHTEFLVQERVHCICIMEHHIHRHNVYISLFCLPTHTQPTMPHRPHARTHARRYRIRHTIYRHNHSRHNNRNRNKSTTHVQRQIADRHRHLCTSKPHGTQVANVSLARVTRRGRSLRVELGLNTLKFSLECYFLPPQLFFFLALLLLLAQCLLHCSRVLGMRSLRRGHLARRGALRAAAGRGNDSAWRLRSDVCFTHWTGLRLASRRQLEPYIHNWVLVCGYESLSFYLYIYSCDAWNLLNWNKYTNIYIFIYIYVYTCMYVYTYTHIHMYIYICIHVYIYADIHVYIYIYMYIYIIMYIYICIYTHNI